MNAEMCLEVPELEVDCCKQLQARLSQEDGPQWHEAFQKTGCFIFRRAFEPKEILALRAYAKKLVLELNQEHSPEQQEDNVVGSRIFHPLGLAQGNVSQSIYANEHVLPVVADVLEDDFLLSEITLISSPPGNDKTVRHYDHTSLFPEKHAKDILDKVPPAYVSLFIPLVDINLLNGTTRCWPGTHLLPHQARMATDASKDFIDPVLEVGDALLLNLCSLHQGMANQSKEDRLYLKISYCRPWFKDSSNSYRYYTPVLSQEEFEGVPNHLKRLFQPYAGPQKDWYFF